MFELVRKRVLKFVPFCTPFISKGLLPWQVFSEALVRGIDLCLVSTPRSLQRSDLDGLAYSGS
jgi:hypothetical protein